MRLRAAITHSGGAHLSVAAFGMILIRAYGRVSQPFASFPSPRPNWEIAGRIVARLLVRSSYMRPSR
jgi:hypothetical protein